MGKTNKAKKFAKIKRTLINTDGSPGREIDLDYIPHDQLIGLIDANDMNAIYFFSFENKLF